MYSHEKYIERINSLFERHQSVQSAGFTGETYKPGLDGMLALAGSLGNPQDSFRSIHVAGTNGKGSVCSMIAAALAGHGYKVGLYTSPHLLDFRERMKIVTDGTFMMIDEQSVWDFLEKADIEGRSFFEITTAMAFWWFALQKVDYAVIEVGLGGLLDSTNIITPELAVVTSIGLDHCAILGNTRAEIAEQKAGIFKRGIPALVWGRDEETESVFLRVAAGAGSPLYFADDNPLPSGVEPDIDGPCRLQNLRTVLSAMDILGISPDMSAICHAGAITGFHGRWELVHTNPDVICDIGHNPPALKLTFGRLEAMDRPVIIIYGVMADKDLDSIAPMMPSSAKYYLVAPGTVRALPSESLAARISVLRPDLVTVSCLSVAEGVAQAISEADGMDNALVFVCGSTFVVSEAVEYLQTYNSQL